MQWSEMGIIRIIGPLLVLLLVGGCACLPGSKSRELGAEKTAQAKPAELSGGGKLSGPVVQ
jgi:hypothetical protein